VTPEVSWLIHILKAKHQALLRQGIWREVLFLTENPWNTQGKGYDAIYLSLGGFVDSPMEMIIGILGVR
jgi:hypothetical protein